MKRTLRGFTFIEVLLYIGILSILGTALFTFAWDTLELSQKSRSDEKVLEESQFILEKITFLLRGAQGVNEAESVWDDANGKLVMNLLGTSDTLTIEQQNRQLTLQRTNEDPVAFHASDFQTSRILFERYRKTDSSISSVGITLTLETRSGMGNEYTTLATLSTAVFLRNLGL